MNKAKYLKMENQKWPAVLQWVEPKDWPQNVLSRESMPVQVWRSKTFLVQIYEDNGFLRLSALRTELGAGGRFRDGISWDEMMRLKTQCGFDNHWAVEVFPPDNEVVNVQNMRHLFILKEPPLYGWHKKGNL